MMMIKDVQARVESDAGQKTWTPQRKGKQGRHTSLGFSINGCQNACKQLLICTNRGWQYTRILTWLMHLGVLNNTASQSQCSTTGCLTVHHHIRVQGQNMSQEVHISPKYSLMVSFFLNSLFLIMPNSHYSCTYPNLLSTEENFIFR